MIEDLQANEGDPILSVSDWNELSEIFKRAPVQGGLSDRDVEVVERAWKRLA
jgi:hypothetical protein